MNVPTEIELTKSIEDAQAAELPDQKSMDKLTLHYIANKVWATEIRKLYLQLEIQATKANPLKAEGTDLDILVAPVLTAGRLPGDYATGQITFFTPYAAPEAISIPAKTRCYALLETGEKIYFITTVAGTLAQGETEATIDAQAEERGINGNVAAYAISRISSYIAGLSSCENRLPIDGGTPDESDDELRERYYDAIQTTGKATLTMLERALNDVTTVSEVKVISYGGGDLGVIVDHSGGVAETSAEIVLALRQNMAGGAQARGVLGATIDGNTVVILPDDTYGGKIWIRPRCHVLSEDSFSLTYQDTDGAEKTATVTVPAGTHRGTMVAATMFSSDSRGKQILAVDPSGNNAYDILLGMGTPGYLYTLPELIEVSLSTHIRLTESPEVGLLDSIAASLTAFLDSYKTAERLEYSDVQRFIYNQFDTSATDYIGRAFVGIGEIVDLSISAGGLTATKLGDRIEIEEDGRFYAGTIDVIDADGS